MSKTCCNCGRVIESGYEVYMDDDIWCEDCYADWNTTYPLKDYHEHHSVKPIFFTTSNENDKLLLGVELEVNSKGNQYMCREDLADIAGGLFPFMPKNFIGIEEDGSLDNGFEIITQPASFDFHTVIKNNYAEAFKYLVESDMRSHNTNCCGLHIHFNRDYFADNEDLYTTRLLYLVEKFWEEITKFSRRTNYSINRWCSRYNGTPEQMVKDYKDGVLGRYYAINLTNKNTIEFRIFRGTLKLNTFIASLQLVETMVKACKNATSIEELQDLRWEDLLKYDEIKSYWGEVKDRVVR